MYNIRISILSCAKSKFIWCFFSNSKSSYLWHKLNFKKFTKHLFMYKLKWVKSFKITDVSAFEKKGWIIPFFLYKQVSEQSQRWNFFVLFHWSNLSHDYDCLFYFLFQAKKTRHWNAGGRALNIETAGYALLTQMVLGRQRYAGPIVSWLTEQRNTKGGFHSTQVCELIIHWELNTCYLHKQ